MDVIFIGGMIDRKLQSKIEPLQNSKIINRIFLIRKREFKGDKIVNINVPNRIIDNYALSEFYRLFNLIKIIIQFRPKYIIGAGLIPHGIYAIIFAKIFFRKSILLLMGELEFPLENPSNSIKQRVLTRIVKSASIIGLRGYNSKERLLNLGYKGKTFIPNNVFSFDNFHPLNLTKDNDIIFIGNIQKEKRIDLLIDIVNRLKVDKGLSVKVKIVGDGKLKDSLVVKSERLELSHQIEFLPFKNQEELNVLINSSKIFALTSEFEGLPMVLIEAMSCGIPAVSFDIADISDVITNKVNGFLIEFNDLTSFVEKAYLLLTNELLYNKMANKCLSLRSTHKEMYTVNYNTSLWEKIIQ